MRYYGLHWVGSDHVPVQFRVDTNVEPDLQIWARWAPSGGQWTSWRRLDVLRNADGTLAETVAEATHAKSADKASALARTCSITFTGDATGQFSFDGTGDVSCNLTVSASGGDGGASGGLSSSIVKPLTYENDFERYGSKAYAPSEEGTWLCFCIHRGVDVDYYEGESGQPYWYGSVTTVAAGQQIVPAFQPNGRNSGSKNIVGGIAFKVG